MAVIYRIRNVANGKFYLGSSVRHRVRFQTHRRQLRKGTHHCPPLQRAWAKYGEDCFKFEVVEQVEEGTCHLAVEARWLDEHHGQPLCYNVSKHPFALWLGLKHSEEAKAKVSRAQKGKKHRLGHINSPDHRARISAAMKGKKKSPEHVEKIRQRMIGTSYAKGRIVTDEQRALSARPVLEVTTGLEFMSVSEAAKHFGLIRPNLIRTLRHGGLLKRGPKAGLRFRYLEKRTLPAA